MVIGSIDLMGGKAVQLRQGREKVIERDDALALAADFSRYNEIAVIDLDAALGKGDNIRIIQEILKVADCRVGGGIRTMERAEELIGSGAGKIIIGSNAFKDGGLNDEFLNALKDRIGPQRIIIALDTADREIVTHGWTKRTGLRLFDVIKGLEYYAKEFLFTVVEREGTMSGFDIDLVRKIRASTSNSITFAGGVSDLNEIRTLAAMDVDVQLGMALYTNRIALADAFIEALNWKKGLIPTIVQDISGTVLMLAYSSEGSLKNTFRTSRMCYFSRSRNELWFKGKTSGNVQELVKVRADCDRDAILAVVRQKGAACHTGDYSCFKTPAFNRP
jgi:phosphoribosyl-ATP pyrophosphohydrolase/phosphoribosyl-AMP cyclohydrolase